MIDWKWLSWSSVRNDDLRLGQDFFFLGRTTISLSHSPLWSCSFPLAVSINEFLSSYMPAIDNFINGDKDAVTAFIDMRREQWNRYENFWLVWNWTLAFTIMPVIAKKTLNWQSKADLQWLDDHQIHFWRWVPLPLPWLTFSVRYFNRLLLLWCSLYSFFIWRAEGNFQ